MSREVVKDIPFASVIDTDPSLGVAHLDDGREVSVRRINYGRTLALVAVPAVAVVEWPDVTTQPGVQSPPDLHIVR